MVRGAFTPPAGWSVADWSRATSIGRTKIFELLKLEKIKSVSFGRRRIITTPPGDFLASLAAEGSHVA